MPNEHQRPASPRAADAGPVPRTPTHAERCRTLAAEARAATLCTVARDPAGYPYGSLVTVAIDAMGRAIFLLSELAEHTGNLHARSEASVLLTEPLGTHDEPLALGRVTLLGRCDKLGPDETPKARETFLATHPSASYYVDFKDFAFYRLAPEALRYVGGFGRMSWVEAAEYAAAEPDPLRGAAAGILRHMNADHAEACVTYAKFFCGKAEATSATITAVDRYGFDLAVRSPEGPSSARVAFDEPVATADAVRRAMVALLGRARGG